MPLQLTQEQVLALAPDAASAAAGRKLGQPKTWKGLGSSDRAVWGECQGSALYQTQVALADLSTKCSCPSRKFPCKHALGLLLIASGTPAATPAIDEPEWVASRLSKREAASEKAAAKKAGEAKPADAEAQAKRASQRHERVLKGLDQLETWLEDLVRQGIARVEDEPATFWEQQAKRLVDAQAPGLALRVRKLAELPRSGPHWMRLMLERMGLLTLAAHAYRRIDELDPLVRQDLRQLVGFTVEQDVVIAEGEKLTDEWMVIAQTVEDDDRVRVQRSWLMGAKSGRSAMVLQFAVGSQPFESLLAPGMTQRSELAFWPSAAPLRALISKRDGMPERATRLVGAQPVSAFLQGWAERLARTPWVDLVPAALAGVTPRMDEGGRMLLTDAAGVTLPLAGKKHDRLLAISGGHPVDVAGEWDGEQLRVLAVQAEGQFVNLTGASLA